MVSRHSPTRFLEDSIAFIQMATGSIHYWQIPENRDQLEPRKFNALSTFNAFNAFNTSKTFITFNVFNTFYTFTTSAVSHTNDLQFNSAKTGPNRTAVERNDETGSNRTAWEYRFRKPDRTCWDTAEPFEWLPNHLLDQNGFQNRPFWTLRQPG